MSAADGKPAAEAQAPSGAEAERHLKHHDITGEGHIVCHGTLKPNHDVLDHQRHRMSVRRTHKSICAHRAEAALMAVKILASIA
jgi:hypothetical protein